MAVHSRAIPLINLFTPFDLMGWWYYATGVEKALIVVGIAALALLAIIIASPYVKPLQFITAKLGLVQERVVIIPVPVNHTVVKYVNQTVVRYVHVNQTVPVPIYINRTIYVPVPSNATLNITTGIPIYNDTGTCSLYSLVLPNGTIWTLGYWIPTPWAWELMLSNGTIITWEKFPAPQYGQQWYSEWTVFAVFPGLGTADLEGIQFLVNIPNTPQPNWLNMIYIGDFMGGGPLMYRWNDYWGVNGGKAVMFNTWSLAQENYTSIVLPVNNTYSVVLVFMGVVTDFPTFAMPCNWTFIGPVNPQVALQLPAPMGVEAQYESWYVNYGNSNYPTNWTTWGFWVWNTNYPPLNVSSLPWPVG